jgi:hypothetical protein
MRPTIAKIGFLKRLPLYQTERPFRILDDSVKSATDMRFTNLEFEMIPTTFEDLRQCNLHSFTLDDPGFTYR